MSTLRERLDAKKAMRIELRLERDFREAMSRARIARRLIQDHLGRTWYTNRIEIELFGESYELVGSEYRDDSNNAVKLQVEHTLARINNHLNAGGYLNLQHWKKVVFAWA